MVTCFATLVWAPVSPDCCRRFLTGYLLYLSIDSNQSLLNATAGQSGSATLWFQTLVAPHFTQRDGRSPSPDTTSCCHSLPFPLAGSAPANLQRLQAQLCVMGSSQWPHPDTTLAPLQSSLIYRVIYVRFYLPRVAISNICTMKHHKYFCHNKY